MSAAQSTSLAFSVSPEIRARLHRALTAWTRDAIIADDLTQETLYEAFRSKRKPEDPTEWELWTFGIARNVLLRYRRSQAAYTIRHLPEPQSAEQLAALGSVDDLDLALTEREVRTFLDQALGHLPIPTRQAMLLRYVDGLSQHETATAMGISEGALESRLHRGKRRIQDYLIREQFDQFRAFGILGSDTSWQEIDEWCHYCGSRRLVARHTDEGDLWADCVACAAPPMNGARSTVLRTFDCAQGVMDPHGLAGRTSFRTAIKNLRGQIYRQTRHGLDSTSPCPRCPGTIAVRFVDASEKAPDLIMQCQMCRFIAGWSWSVSSGLSHPFVREWIDRQDRTRLVPEGHCTSVNNRSALGIRLESVGSTSTIAVWRDRETMKFLQIERDGKLLSLDNNDS